jgi:hypothetical protein
LRDRRHGEPRKAKHPGQLAARSNRAGALPNVA